MKRLYHLTVSSLNLIHLSGITWLYGILTLIYIVIIMMVNVSWRNAVSSLLIFSDPAAMGLYFMGAVVLLEKSQRVDAYVAITPVKSSEYVFFKSHFVLYCVFMLWNVTDILCRLLFFMVCIPFHQLSVHDFYTLRYYSCPKGKQSERVHPWLHSIGNDHAGTGHF